LSRSSLSTDRKPSRVAAGSLHEHHVLGLTTEWQHLSGHALAGVAIAAAPLEQRESKTHEAHDDLRLAIGMHEKV
jgi:hypothetical protein